PSPGLPLSPDWGQPDEQGFCPAGSPGTPVGSQGDIPVAGEAEEGEIVASPSGNGKPVGLEGCLEQKSAEQCSYIPPCARDDQENSENVTYKQKYWKEKVGSQPFTCYFNQHLRPDDVMLKRTHDETVLLHCFLWPVVTFLVGVLIVVLTICAKSLAVRAEAIKKKKHL
ncbi:PREDICTED: calcium-activated potassium channel subunit beta-4, partial [Apaloderma vittatum]|uniref:calcium-activated potassium channel subunit beta-4 n=1 Tax=Apaloderma vittatum TaxID=57397 RepID=UPI0005217A51